MYPIIFLTQEEMKARWDKDLCYNCDEVYSFEHRCAKIQFYMLKDEEEGDEEEVEIMFDSEGVDPEPETKPLVKEIKPPDSTIVTGLSQLQEAPAEASIDAKETKSWPKPTLNPNPYTPPITLPIQIQPTQSFNQSTKRSKTINLNTDPTPNLPTLPYPNRKATITPPNQNLPTLSNPNPNTHPIQTQSFQAVNHNTAAFLDANRPEPWPNKPSINTNPNRPNPWPNKLPKLTYFIRPKPWPDEPPIYKHKPRTGSNETRKFGKQTRRRRSYQFQLLVESKSDDHLQTSPMAAKVRILDFPVTIHALKGVHYQFRSTLSRAATIDFLDSDELKETRGDPGTTLTDEAAPVASMPIQLKEMKIEGGDRLRSSPGRLPTLFLGVVRPRARPERQLLDSPEANRILNRFQNRVLTVAQLRNLVIAILRHLPEFDPGDQRPIEDERALSFNLGAASLATVTITITRRLTTHHRVCSAAEQPKPFPNLFVEVHEGLKKNWDLASRDFGLKEVEEARVLNDSIWGLIEEEIRDLRRGIGDFNPRDFGSSMKTELGISESDIWGFLVKLRSKEDKGSKVFNGMTPNPISKRCRFDASRIGLAGAFGELGRKQLSRLGRTCNFQFLWAIGRPEYLSNKLDSNFVGPCQDWAIWPVSKLLQILVIWAINIFGPLLQLDSFQSWQIRPLFHLPSLRTRMFSKRRECKDWEIRY